MKALTKANLFLVALLAVAVPLAARAQSRGKVLVVMSGGQGMGVSVFSQHLHQAAAHRKRVADSPFLLMCCDRRDGA
jgi:pantothenate kinase-related protein Tda10